MTRTVFEAINNFNALYVARLDEDQLEEWPSFFEETCLYKITTLENYELGRPAGLVYADSKNMLIDRINSLRDANIYERHRYRHLIGFPLVRDESSDSVSAETPFIVCRTMRSGETSVFATGKYVDELAVGGTALKIKKRIVVCDSVSIDTLLAIPL